MLQVVSSEQAKNIIFSAFSALPAKQEILPLQQCAGRVLAEELIAMEDIPGFIRSSVDGYAVFASDTFGCSLTLPALLRQAGSVEMGHAPGTALTRGQCIYVPTGGQLPDGSDAMVMIEHAEAYGDGTIGVLKPAAPGQHCVFRGDDIKAKQPVLHKGKLLQPHDIGALAALGIEQAPVACLPLVGILSTGDELVPVGHTPAQGQMRDVNTHLLHAAVEKAGCKAKDFGICPDDSTQMRDTVAQMASTCDILLLSGGTSVGKKDMAPTVIASLGSILFHGIAVKPGKPSLCGVIQGKPVFGLPGHPAAAYFIFREFVMPLLFTMQGRPAALPIMLQARLLASIPSNHGREEFVAVRIAYENNAYTATPLHGKSGLISLLSSANGYIRVPRNLEGLHKDEFVSVIPFLQGE